MAKLIDYIQSPRKIAVALLSRIAPLIKNDETYIRTRWRVSMGYKLNLDNPRTFQEKLQWLKLHDHRNEYTQMVDKVEVKRYVADKIGEEYIIPTLGVWNTPNEIDFSSLPEQFVIKCNHNSGKGMYICKDKQKMNIPKVKRALAKGLSENYFAKGREWPYKNVKRRIIAEQYLTDGNEELTDYKFYCFDGEPKYCQVIKDRQTEETIDFFDMDWNHQEFVGLNPVARPAAVCPKRPVKYEEMQYIARQLSEEIPFVRIDLYEVNGSVYFGEITFYPAKGMGVFTPQSWDITLGNWIVLPQKFLC